MTVRASDPDAGVVRFSLSSGADDFEVGERSGVVTVARGLDRERVAAYDITVRATDEGGRSVFYVLLLERRVQKREIESQGKREKE